jgi:hypothetical protein
MNIYQKPILLKGYHPDHNPTRDYKTAKKPAPSSTGWTKPEYRPPTADQIQIWISAGGWVGHLVPEGMHVIDAEDQAKISLIREICRRNGITPPINKTNNGLQFAFSINGGPPLPGADAKIIRMGFPVTYRAAGKNYLILPPTNGREWENEAALDNLPVIPDELLPAQNTIEDTTRALAWALGEAHRKGLLAGYDDLDGGFMSLLVSCEITEAQILEAFQLLFLQDFDEHRTLTMYQRTKERKATGEPITGTGSLVQSLKDKGLDAIVATITKLERLSVKTAPGGEKKKADTKTTGLIKLALAGYDLFHDKDGKPYATIRKEKHSETYPLRSKSFRTSLSGMYWEQFGEGLGSQIMQDALGTLESHAIHGGPCLPVYVRLAAYNETIYVDLGNDSYEVIEITSGGWRVLKDQNVVKFRRPSGMTALPYPKAGGSLNQLKKYINLANPEDWPILVGFLLICFHPWGPYPILILLGEQGSAKTTAEKAIKALTDPSTAPLRSLPRETRDLAIHSLNSHVLAYDNLSDIPGAMSDALCRQATGSGYATRTLYSDDEETIIDTKSPVMLNGISNVVERHDLADRSLSLNMAVIPDERRIPEADFWGDFEDDAPEILGAILDAVSGALANYKTVQLPKVPRMADFCVWGTAAEKALGWSDGLLLKAYSKNRREVTAMTLEADQVGLAVKAFMELLGNSTWKGTATELLDALDSQVGERTRKTKSWPRSANALSGKLKRSATSLRAEGIEVTFNRGGKRTIHLEQGGGKIVTTVTEENKDTQPNKSTSETPVTMFEEGIVTGSSQTGKDRHQFRSCDDVGDSGDDAEKRSSQDERGKDDIKSYGCKRGDGRDDGDDDSPSPFQDDVLREEGDHANLRSQKPGCPPTAKTQPRAKEKAKRPPKIQVDMDFGPDALRSGAVPAYGPI